MDNSNAKSERAHPRLPLQCDLTKFLVTAESRDPIRCMGTDVSREGLGIVSFSKLEEGTEVIFQIQQRGIVLHVVWCKQDQTRESVYHLGLKTTDIAVNLVSLLQAEGLIPPATKSALSKDNDPQSQKKPEKVKDIDFSELRAVIINLHTCDQRLLRNGPLEKLSATHKAFPINYSGASLVVMLPNDLRPSAVKNLGESEAAEKIFVLQKLGAQTEKAKWTKVWPS